MLVLAPSQNAQGGISTVIINYARTGFWRDFNCEHFPTTDDYATKWSKALSDVLRLAAFPPRLIFRGRPNVISVHTSHDISFYRKLAYILMEAAFRVPVVLHVHPASFSHFYRSGGAARKFTVRLASSLSDQVVFLSESIRTELADAFPLDKSSVLPNPVDVEEYESEPRLRIDSRQRILFMGWIVREKGVYDIVDAMPEVLRSFPSVVFTFAGNKEIDKLKAKLDSRGLSRSAEVLGWVRGEQKRKLLGTASVLVLPSYSEGAPNVLLEAMASSLPIITTPVGGIPSILKHNETAIFVEPGNVSALAEAINCLLADDVRCTSLAARAFDLVSKKYDLAAASAGLARIYDRYRPLPCEKF
jgi:glycosyltransferase involved in cell wall biosynthesis